MLEAFRLQGIVPIHKPLLAEDCPGVLESHVQGAMLGSDRNLPAVDTFNEAPLRGCPNDVQEFGEAGGFL